MPPILRSTIDTCTLTEFEDVLQSLAEDGALQLIGDYSTRNI